RRNRRSAGVSHRRRAASGTATAVCGRGGCRMTTAARVQSAEAAHFYTKTGEPMHFIERSDGQGTRPTTLRDAKKLGLLPSPTSILKVLRAPQLEAWKMEQAALAVLTA